MKRFMKYMAGFLALILVLTSVAASVYAKNDTESTEKSASEEETNEAESEEEEETLTEEEESSSSSQETVYVFTETDGEVRKVMVSNGEGEAKTVEDSDSSLPISMKVSYFLNGEEIQASDLSGKSGKVTIRFDFENLLTREETVGEEKESVHVPFAVLTGMLLDNETFRNVEVKNGRILSDGDRTVVVGMTFPGLSDDLKLSEELVSIPDWFEVSADVTDFSMGITMSVATNQVFNELDISGFDSLDELKSSMTELSDAMSQLIQGSSDLSDGLNKLNNSTEELANGVEKLNQGAGALSDGAASLKSGAESLQAGVDSLQAGIASLAGNNESLQMGAKQVFQSLIDSANTNLSTSGLNVPELTIENYSTVLTAVIASLEPAAAQSPAAAAAVQSLTGLKTSLDSYNGFYQGLISYTNGVASASHGAAELKNGSAALTNGAASLYEGSVSLHEGTKSLNEKMPELKSGVQALTEGSESLKEGLEKLNEEGIQKLTKALNEDLSGVVDRLKASKEASGSYTSFLDSEKVDGQVKFIFRTDEIQ